MVIAKVRTGESVVAPCHAPSKLQPYWVPANWSAFFIELWKQREQSRSTAARSLASPTRPEIRLSIINNLISLNWRELATTHDEEADVEVEVEVEIVVFMIDRLADGGRTVGVLADGNDYYIIEIDRQAMGAICQLQLFRKIPFDSN